MPRPRLIDALTHWADYRVIRVTAPAGFGKSTLAAMWLHDVATQSAEPRPLVVWIPLTSADSALDVFVDHLTTALADASPPLPRIREAAELAAAGEFALPQVAHVLSSALAAAGRTIILALDDLHLIRPGQTIDLLQLLLDSSQRSDALHFLLLSRTRPPLDFSRLQLDEDVLSFNVDDLIFDADEFAAFAALNRLAELPPDQLTLVERRAGGWAAGLQLIAQALPANRPLSADTLSFVSDADLWTYIENVLFERDSARISFLVDTALLPILSADLCAAVTERPHAECAALLENIAAANSLVTSHTLASGSRPGSAYRVHPILREFLLRRLLHAADPNQLLSARRRAAQRCVQRNDVDAALDLLLSSADDGPLAHAPDLDFAADLLPDVCRTAILRGEILAARRWIDRLPDSAVRARPPLAVASAWCAFHLMDAQLQRHLDRAMESVQSACSDPRNDENRAEIAVLEALTALHYGHMHRTLHRIHDAEALHRAADGITAGYLHVMRGYLMYGEPRTLEERRREIKIGHDIFTRNDYLRGRIEALVCDQWVCSSYGEPGVCLSSGEHTLRVIADAGMQSSAFGLYALLYYAQDLYLLDRIADARVELERFVERISSAGLSTISVYHARVRLQLCDLVDGADDLAGFDPVTDAGEWAHAMAHASPTISASTAYMRILRDSRLGRLERIRDTMQLVARSIVHIDRQDSYTTLLPVLTGAVLSGSKDDSVMEQLIELRRHCETMQRVKVAQMTRTVQVVHLHMLGRSEDALAELRTLLDDVERGLFTRILRDFAHLLRPLLERVGTRFADDLLRPPTRLNSGAPFGLSATELRVLHQLTDGRNTPEIARAMVLSVTTVRTHVQNIYRKLRVHRRSDALQVAKTAGLL